MSLWPWDSLWKGIPARSRRRSPARVPLSGVILMSVVVLIAGGILVGLAFQSRHSPRPQLGRAARSFVCQPGPWGRVDCTEIIVQMGDEAITEQFITDVPSVWRFPGCDFKRLLDLFNDAGIDYQKCSPILDTAQLDPNIGGYVVSPSDDFIIGLSPSARAAIYAVLGATELNVRQNEPFWFPAERADDWFEDSGLADSTVELVRKMLYPRGRMLAFADIDVVFRQVPDKAERSRLVKTLARTPALMMSLHVDPGQDIRPLVDYWKIQDPALLDSLSRGAGGDVGMAHLLPKFAVERLYKYPRDKDANWDRQNCYWSALNFDRESPDERFEDLGEISKEIRANYTSIERDDLRFGDMILLMKSENEAVHGCIYIADNIVFTKNGPGRSSPWILMKLADVLGVYQMDESSIKCYRHTPKDQ